MIFNPQNIINKNGTFSFSRKVEALANPVLNKEILKELWHEYSYKSSELVIHPTEEMVFMIGSNEKPTLDGNAYAVNVTKDGICVVAEDEKSLIDGFMTLIDRIKPIDLSNETTLFNIECCEIKETPLIKNRFVHFCVFPETELWELERFVRLCGALKYTHLILEFWGTLKFDCLKELAWENSFSKEEIRPIVQLANDLGMKTIPMFNHWGHASASRVSSGKHVVLNQNPALQMLFSEDGWCWNIEKREVRELLKNIREELITLCGNGEYFHIGCDEAYNFSLDKKNMDMMCDYINEIHSDLKAKGYKTIIWGDMFLCKDKAFNPNNHYYATCPDKEKQQYMLSKLNKEIVIADWQYNAVDYPVETSAIFVNAGFETFLCPWDRGMRELDACIKTAKELRLSGIIHTTWHTLSKGLPYVVMAAIKCWEQNPSHQMDAPFHAKTAALLRKVFSTNGEYKKTGWAEFQIGTIFS